MTRKAPAFQLYADDFLAGTFDMSAEEVGVYIRMLCTQWSRGPLTRRQVDACGGTEESRDYVLEAKFAESSEGSWVNQRLESVRAERQAKSESGSKGGSKTQALRQANGQANSQAPHQASGQAVAVANRQAKSKPPTPTPTPTPDPSSSPVPIKAATTKDAAAEFDFSIFEDTLDRRIAATEAARKLHGAVGNVLELDYIWRVAWITEAICPGWCSDIVPRFRRGGIESYKRYCDGALRSELDKLGLSLHQVTPHIPPRIHSQPQSATA